MSCKSWECRCDDNSRGKRVDVERGIYAPIPGCVCTYEEGDSDCGVHPRCSECGADLEKSRVAQERSRLAQALSDIRVQSFGAHGIAFDIINRIIESALKEVT